jgi:hypothetical protein
MEFLFVLLLQAVAGDPAQPPTTDPAQQTEQAQAAAGEPAATPEAADPPRRMRCTRRAPTGARLERRVCDSQENIDRRQEQAEDAAREMQRMRSGTPPG